MTTRDVLAEFDRLVGEAEALTDDLERDREPEFEAVLADVLAHPAERAALALKLIEMLRSSADSDLLEFCMHELRWSEAQGQVEAAMQEAANNGDHRLQFGPGGVLPAFRDGWLDGRGGGYKGFAWHRSVWRPRRVLAVQPFHLPRQPQDTRDHSLDILRP